MTVMSDSNIEIVEGIYEAFGRGDVDAILAVLSEDVNWAAEAETPVAAWHGTYKGKGEVPSFFVGIATTIDVTEFTQISYASNDTDVMVVSRFGFTSKATGKSGAMNLHHWWHFEDGKVAHYRGSEDTALVAEVLTP